MNSNPRRKDRIITDTEADEILDVGEYGVLGTIGADGAPYCVPLNYVRDGRTLILHCTLSGHKIDNLRHENRVSFCVVEKAETVGEKFTTRYESVIVSGRVQWINEDTQKIDLLTKFVNRFASDDKPNSSETVRNFIDRHLKQTLVLVLQIEKITGKANRQMQYS